MRVHLTLRNESRRKGNGIYRRDWLVYLAQRVCAGEGLSGEVELSLLFCDDSFIQELNRNYRKKNAPTDVLSFGQSSEQCQGMKVLGDIVISLETVESRCAGDRRAMRNEVDLLVCHGLLHLLGLDHATQTDKETMNKKQAQYLFLDPNKAWHQAP